MEKTQKNIQLWPWKTFQSLVSLHRLYAVNRPVAKFMHKYFSVLLSCMRLSIFSSSRLRIFLFLIQKMEHSDKNKIQQRVWQKSLYFAFAPKNTHGQQPCSYIVVCWISVSVLACVQPLVFLLKPDNFCLGLIFGSVCWWKMLSLILFFSS